ncbi:MAG: serine/threonine protein kinase [Vulcanimicrobiota bacterium]
MLRTGDIVKDRYKVLRVLGQGGMSTVYLVEDQVLENQWAMKETLDVFPDKDKSEILDQFKKEAKILANLSHSNLPRVIDYFEENQVHYLVEEFIEGKSSEEILNQGGNFDEVRIINWGVQICDLLDFLHENGIIYRDLKPGNIMIDANDQVYLVDFGIARFFQGGKARDTVIIGTPGFASPEHYGRGETDQRSDIYSLGATLHYMLTGVDPADKPFHFEIPYFVNSAVSFETSSIVMKCLDLDPNRRFQKAGDIKKALENRALPNLQKRTAPLSPPARLIRKESFANQTDLLGKTAQFLSYSSVFPASMGISGVLAFVMSALGPLPSFFLGSISFPLLCIEFWKRLDNVFEDQNVSILTEPEELVYKSKKMNLESKWKEFIELRIIKNTGLAVRPIREVRVKTRSGEFSFDASYKDFHRLIDTIITQAGLSLIEEGPGTAIYRRL